MAMTGRTAPFSTTWPRGPMAEMPVACSLRRFNWWAVRRLLVALFAALALFVAPAGMMGGAAKARSMANHAEMAAGHCEQGREAGKKAPSLPGMTPGCALACTALPSVEPRIEAPADASALAFAALPLPHFAGLTPESVDPPPRA